MHGPLNVKRIEFVGDGVSYAALIGRCFNIVVLNVQAPSETKSDDIKTTFTRN